MISLKSILNFLKINSILISLGLVQFYILLYYPLLNIPFNFIRNYCLTKFTDFMLINKPNIGKRKQKNEIYYGGN